MNTSEQQNHNIKPPSWRLLQIKAFIDNNRLAKAGTRLGVPRWSWVNNLERFFSDQQNHNLDWIGQRDKGDKGYKGILDLT